MNKEEKVGFIVLGAPKCATTSVAKILSDHSEIGFSKVKEPNFFSEEVDWKGNIVKYHSLFNFKEKKTIYGEASTTYSFYPKYNLDICNDIFEYNRDMKFIYIVRDPYKRTFSQYLHWIDRGYISSAFKKSIFSHPEIIFTSMYYMQISPFIEKFGKENVLILRFEDFVRDKINFLKEISNFLGVNFNEFRDFENIFENKSSDGGKKHHKLDEIKKNFNFARILPKSVISFCWNIFANIKRPKSINETELSTSDKELVFRILKTDLEAFEKRTGINYFD